MKLKQNLALAVLTACKIAVEFKTQEEVVFPLCDSFLPQKQMDILRANRVASIIAQAVVLPMMIFPTTVSTLAAQTPESYEKLISLAQAYVKESKYEQALDQLTKAYAIQPSPQLLGGEITLEFLHRHDSGQCYGSMMVGKSQIKWSGHGKADHFEVAPRDVGLVNSETYYASTYAQLGGQRRAGGP